MLGTSFYHRKNFDKWQEIWEKLNLSTTIYLNRFYVQEQDYPNFFSKTTYGRVFITRLSRYYIACTLILLKKRASKNVFYKMRFKGARLYEKIW